MKQHIFYDHNPPDNPRLYHYDRRRDIRIALLWVAFFVTAILIWVAFFAALSDQPR